MIGMPHSSKQALGFGPVGKNTIRWQPGLEEGRRKRRLECVKESGVPKAGGINHAPTPGQQFPSRLGAQFVAPRVRDFFSRGDSSQLSVIRFSIPAFPQNQTACGQGASPGSGLTRPRCRSLPQQTVAARRAALRTLADGFQPRGDPPEKLVPRCNQVGDDGNRICPCI